MPYAVAGTERRKIRSQFEVMSVPFYPVREGDTRGAKHGQTQWQYDHWKARDATMGAKKRGTDSNVQRWKEDETYRASQTAHGWTEEFCSYLDCLAPIDISYIETWKERSKYEISPVLKLRYGKHPGRMTRRKDLPQAARVLAALQRKKGRVNPYVPKNER